MKLYDDAMTIVKNALEAARPDNAVRQALGGKSFVAGHTYIVAVGKASWEMAKAAAEVIGPALAGGVVITKHGYARGAIAGLSVYEAGHPVPDAAGFFATQKAIDLVTPLSARDCVVFLVSGGGSALFEKPLVAPETLRQVTGALLAAGADIVEMNTVRKRLSAVKGGRFAKLCAPARVFSVVLSDIVGDPVDMIASGPAAADRSTSAQALAVVRRYKLDFPEEVLALLAKETPRAIDNVDAAVTGGVRQLCLSAEQTCAGLGYRAAVLTDALTCTARDAGSFLASIARYHAGSGAALAFIAGGETIVRVTGKGLGGRNQELALSAAAGIDGCGNVCVFSVGSDGTDGPTDAAGGYVDGTTAGRLREKGIDIAAALNDNDAYHALKAAGGLIVTGPTGTNVNDLSVTLISAS